MVRSLQGNVFLLALPRFTKGFFDTFLQPDNALFMLLNGQTESFDKFIVDFTHYINALSPFMLACQWQLSGSPETSVIAISSIADTRF